MKGTLCNGTKVPKPNTTFASLSAVGRESLLEGNVAYIKVRVENDGRFSKHNTLKVHGRCRSDRTSNGPKDVLDRRAATKTDLFSGGRGEGTGNLENPGWI